MASPTIGGWTLSYGRLPTRPESSMRRPALLSSLLSLSLIAVATPAAAQRSSDYDDSRWLQNCREGWNGDDRGRACEIRVVPVKSSGRALEIDGRENGSIRVVSWAGDSVRVMARIQANARSDDAAQGLLKDVRVVADGKRVYADGARGWGRNENWSVSYVVYVPRRYDLSLEAHNGSLGVTGVVGKMDLRTENGSVNLTDVGGDVRART